jgi:hypothetical protein
MKMMSIMYRRNSWRPFNKKTVCLRVRELVWEKVIDMSNTLWRLNWLVIEVNS